MAERPNTPTEADNRISDEELAKHYKRCLENWREVLVHTHSLLLWDKPYYPGIIAGYLTFIFIILWYFEPSILTAVSLLGAVAFVLDFAVPTLSSSVFDPNKWTGVQERKYEEICHGLVRAKKTVGNAYKYIIVMRETKPKMYFMAVVGALLLVAWIGNTIDNLLLMYLVVLVGFLLPGMKHHGVLQEQISSVSQTFTDMIMQRVKKFV